MNRIHYAQCWEDSTTLLNALKISREDNVISIASGGDNTLDLILKNPKTLTAIDSNPAQIYLFELKIKAIQKLNYNDFIEFLGLNKCEKRTEIYNYLRNFLSAPAKKFWDKENEKITKGIIHCGKFESYFSYFRRFVIPLIHSKRSVIKLLSAVSLEQQKNFYNKVWNNWRWRALFKIFFGKFLLGYLGRDPSFFKYVTVNNIADELFKRTQRGFTEIPVNDNYFLHYIFTGKYENNNVPPYLRETNFKVLKRNVGRIKLVLSSLESYLNNFNGDSISKFNLSDIFEYMDYQSFISLLNKIIGVGHSGAKIAFRTLFVPYTIPEKMQNQISSDTKLSNKLIDSDKTFFYGNFCIWDIKTDFTKSTNPKMKESIIIPHNN